MTPARFLVLLLVFAPLACAQLQMLSFDAGTSFRQDNVNTDFYFSLPEGSAHFDFKFDAAKPLSHDDYVRIRVTKPDGTPVFDEHRTLDRVGVSTEDQRYFLAFTKQKNDGPIDRRYYENFRFEMFITPGWVDEDGVFVPPDVQIDSYSELYVAGWSPMIDYVPPGYSGAFGFDRQASNVTQEFVPVPEPSIYGLAALSLLSAVVAYRRWRDDGTDSAVDARLLRCA
jgi:hypothetical protein